jgi:hypothetical protein
LYMGSLPGQYGESSVQSGGGTSYERRQMFTWTGKKERERVQ